ncbi:MAG: DUF4255 domain-containing protein [Bacteroidota bacterium]
MAIHVIDAAIQMIATEVNNYLLISPGNEIVIPSNLLTQSGSLVQGLDGHIVMSLVNIEEDRISRPLNVHRKLSNGTVETIKPEVRLNLYFLFTAVPASTNVDTTGATYVNSVRNLSRVIGFFQTKNFFDIQNTPSLEGQLGRIWMELYPLTFEQQNHLWGAMGAKYMPSIMYKVRIVTIQENEVQFDGPPITQVNLNGQASS